MIPLKTLERELGYDQSPTTGELPRLSSRRLPTNLSPVQNHGGTESRGNICVHERPRIPSQSPYSFPSGLCSRSRGHQRSPAPSPHLLKLCSTPFAIILPPGQIPVYSGFIYSETDEQTGLLDSFIQKEQLHALLRELNASAIDSGRIWKSAIAWSYTDIRDNNLENEEETTITAYLFHALHDRLRNTDAPSWCKYYSIAADRPENKTESPGKRSPKPDLVIESSNKSGRPEYVFEAKRLKRPRNDVSHYLGEDGMGCFISGKYASDYPEPLCSDMSKAIPPFTGMN